MKFLARVAAPALILVLAVLVVSAWLVYAPFGPTSETLVDIPTGTGTRGIASLLEEKSIIRSALVFDLFRLQRAGTLRAGVYRFDHPAPIAEVYARILRGDVYTRAVSIPEGYNIFDIAQAIEAAHLASKADFLAAERRDTALIADWSPHAPSLEGFLFPATYRFSPHTTPDQMLAAMVHRFRQAAAQLNLPPETIAPTVNMASIIEKEVGQDAERPLVAGVFVNRLALGMPLQTDPTVIYAALLEGRYRGTIYRSDLASPSPYNTYRHAGLPPGPICNPGMAAMRAALHPAPTDFLYFVADAAGHTRFAATPEQHQQNVAAYRQAERARAHP